MQKLMAELGRLYLPGSTLSQEALARHLSGEVNTPVSLVTADGQVRAMVIAFDKLGPGEDGQHWSLLCLAANALQAELGLPAPAVSISGAKGFRLWLSLAAPVPVVLAQQFMALLHAAYFPGMALAADAASVPVALPPCLHSESGRWAAFINPGLGASFADEAGLEMAPPLAGQAALLEGLERISQQQFQHAMDVLQRLDAATPAPGAQPAARAPVQEGLLLKDATLEQIVAHLHGLHIEPTFRHLIRHA